MPAARSLRPESFRGGCSFGAPDRPLSQIGELSRADAGRRNAHQANQALLQCISRVNGVPGRRRGNLRFAASRATMLQSREISIGESWDYSCFFFAREACAANQVRGTPFCRLSYVKIARSASSADGSSMVAGSAGFSPSANCRIVLRRILPERVLGSAASM